MANGLHNLLIDIGIHDTIYTSLMAYGVSHHIFDAWILSIISFFVALPPAILVKYAGNELLHHLQKNYTKLHGFHREKYYEARFIVNQYHNPGVILQETAERFDLTGHDQNRYYDRYFNHRMPSFSDRNGTIKLREITSLATDTTIQNLEIAHTLSTKKSLHKNSIQNFFYSSKEKGKKDLTDMDFDLLSHKYPYRGIIKSPGKEVVFDREAYYDKELRITLDHIIQPTHDQLRSVIELKVYKDTKYLMEAMKYIMSKGKVSLTTYGKNDLL